jgi:hypothetical protein
VSERERERRERERQEREKEREREREREKDLKYLRDIVQERLRAQMQVVYIDNSGDRKESGARSCGDDIYIHTYIWRAELWG